MKFTLCSTETLLQSRKKSALKKKISHDELTIDQTVLQYWMILALQDSHTNYYLPSVKENRNLKADINELISLIKEVKQKNDKIFDFIINKLK